MSATVKIERVGNTKSTLKSRKWCFTLNNYSVDMTDTLTQHFLKKEWNYIFGKEVGSKMKTPHLQGFILAKNAIRFDTLKKLMPTAHLEVAKGSVEENYKYCSKENDYYTNIIDVVLAPAATARPLSKPEMIAKCVEDILNDSKEKIKILGMNDIEYLNYVEN